MVNMALLNNKIKNSEKSIEAIALEINMDKSTLYRKLKANGKTFSVQEANSIAKSLKLSAKEATDIFFNQPVA